MRILILSLLTILFQTSLSAQENPGAVLKLYLLDCGILESFNMANFSITGEYDDEKATLANGCFLIRHQQGDLLWDLGLSEDFVIMGPLSSNSFLLSVDKSLVEQLAEIELQPKDIEFVSISHSHFDHISQISSFPTSTWLVDEKELSSMRVESEFKSQFADFKNLSRKVFTSDYDVFGDGSVMIVQTPGHTPGHTVLQVMLKETGPVLLAGDLYHQERTRQLKLVPVFNTNEAQTRESFERFESIVSELDAKVIIQHEKGDIELLPKLPDFLQ